MRQVAKLNCVNLRPRVTSLMSRLPKHPFHALLAPSLHKVSRFSHFSLPTLTMLRVMMNLKFQQWANYHARYVKQGHMQHRKHH
jgi:hypothetical protein